MLPPETALAILHRLDLATLYRIRYLDPCWKPLVLDALHYHLKRTSILITFEQEERWRLRVEIPFLHFDLRTLLCTFVPQRDPRTARRYYRSMFLRQPVVRAIRRQTRWERGRGICILRRSANLLDRSWPVEIHRSGLHRIARRDAAGRDWECIYYVTRDRPLSELDLQPSDGHHRHTTLHPQNADILAEHEFVPGHAPHHVGYMMPNTHVTPPFNPAAPAVLDREEPRRSGERWLCPAAFQCHLGFLIGMHGPWSNADGTTGNLHFTGGTKVSRDPDANLVRCEPGKRVPPSTAAWFMRWLVRIFSLGGKCGYGSSGQHIATSSTYTRTQYTVTAEETLRAQRNASATRTTAAPALSAGDSTVPSHLARAPLGAHHQHSPAAADRDSMRRVSPPSFRIIEH
ncbi:hypothetical protein THASP1DRAFT_31935 [Thamnocephalis sphaerospora]|uniref:F-box domain-containing protein n=1 Tax=Thamnocephalis sphaerospora TaxID=78915 RepID=A0A4P9XKC3_9FUNG|nr:hypothetical protein THASP1DRAFT_31935 [Thamnocephalis sphaerospora]|eukprot:RKP06248.1 hypothetical protein THASP1DRAFT_31935 [Thamnocephalis sphaerospora]